MDAYGLVAGLIFDCPLKKDDPDCPFREIRKKPINERVNILLNGFKKSEINYLEVQHKLCFKLKP